MDLLLEHSRHAIKNKRPWLEFSLVLISSLPLVSWSRTFQCDLEWAQEPLPPPRLSEAQTGVRWTHTKQIALLMPILITLTQARSNTNFFVFFIIHFKEASNKHIQLISLLWYAELVSFYLFTWSNLAGIQDKKCFCCIQSVMLTKKYTFPFYFFISVQNILNTSNGFTLLFWKSHL